MKNLQLMTSLLFSIFCVDSSQHFFNIFTRFRFELQCARIFGVGTNYDYERKWQQIQWFALLKMDEERAREQIHELNKETWFFSIFKEWFDQYKIILIQNHKFKVPTLFNLIYIYFPSKIQIKN